MCPNRKLVLKMYHAKKTSTRVLYVGLCVALTPDIFKHEHLHFSKAKKKVLFANLLDLVARFAPYDIKFFATC